MSINDLAGHFSDTSTASKALGSSSYCQGYYRWNAPLGHVLISKLKCKYFNCWTCSMNKLCKSERVFLRISNVRIKIVCLFLCGSSSIYICVLRSTNSEIYAKHHSSVPLLLKLGKIFIPYPNVLPELLINAYTVDTHFIISSCNACFVIVVSVFLAWMHQWPKNMNLNMSKDFNKETSVTEAAQAFRDISILCNDYFLPQKHAEISCVSERFIIKSELVGV